MLDTDAQQLHSTILFTATLAEQVSGIVRQLDLAKSHALDCAQMVEDILDRQLCAEGVHIAMQDEDFERAAGHIHRLRNLDETVVRMERATSDISGVTLADSAQQLYDAEMKLSTIVHSRFYYAVHREDAASVERVFLSSLCSTCMQMASPTSASILPLCYLKRQSGT